MKTNKLSQQEQANINGGTSVGHEPATPENTMQPDDGTANPDGSQPDGYTNVPFDGGDKQPIRYA